MIFKDRQEAGKKLARRLYKYKKEDSVILAMPRGGVPVGFEIAQVLQAPLNVIVVRKIGLPSNPEFGIGAIAENGVRVLDEKTIKTLGISEEQIQYIIDLEEKELQRRIQIYRDGQPLPDLSRKIAILVDDGLATGITAKAATRSVRKLNPKKILLATPVCALDTVEELKNSVDEMVCLDAPQEFMAVGQWYKNFTQVTDQEVVDLLKQAEQNFKR